MLDEAAHDLADFGRGSHDPAGAPQSTGTLRRLPGGDGPALVPQPKAAVGKFEDLYLPILPELPGPSRVRFLA